MRRVEADYQPLERHAHQRYWDRPPPLEQLLDTGTLWLEPPVEVRCEDALLLCALEPTRSRTWALLLEGIDMCIRHPWDPHGLKRRQHDSIREYPGASFGSVEPSALMRRMAPSIAVTATRFPDLALLLYDLVEEAWVLLGEECPELRDGFAAAPQAHRDWRLNNTPFTSCIVNANVAAPLHRDTGNVPYSGSVMWVMRQHVTGGHLYLPELNAVLRCDHGTMVAFYGETIWHSVTRVEGVGAPRAGRYSLVGYSRQGLLRQRGAEGVHRRAAEHGTRLGDDRRDTVLRD